METNAVTKVVTDEISISAKFMGDLKMFALTKGLDLIEAVILFIVGYIVCRYIRKAVEHILERSNVDPSAKTFISEIIFFFCLIRSLDGSINGKATDSIQIVPCFKVNFCNGYRFCKRLAQWYDGILMVHHRHCN